MSRISKKKNTLILELDTPDDTNNKDDEFNLHKIGK
jgi:hypothetical protein